MGKFYLLSSADYHLRNAWACRYPNKMLVNAVLMNRAVLTTLETIRGSIAVVLLENGQELCSRPNHRKANGIEENVRRTFLDEPIRVEGRRRWFATITEIQVALDKSLVTYNRKRSDRGRGINERTPSQVLRGGLPSPKTTTATTQEEQKAV